MKSKEEILDHLSKTVYTHNARRSIVEWMLQMGYIKSKSDVKFANHVYNRDGVRMTEGLSFEDFIHWTAGWESIPVGSGALTSGVIGFMEETAHNIANILNGTWHYRDIFKVGDWVQYMPEPGESSTEVIEAIARNEKGGVEYLCLSNGEFVRPCYCVKYKAQGEERRKLIDKLNEVR